MRHVNNGLSCLCVLTALAWSGLTSAQSLTVVSGAGARASMVAMTPAESWRAVSDRRLDVTRGGFDSGNGLLASFGLDRLVYVNGNLVSSSSVQIPDVAHINRQQADALAAASAVNVIQIGAGNSFDPAALRQTMGATVIQNTLDNQNIQSVTRLNATVNNLNLFNSLNLQSSLQSALIDSRGR